MHHPYQCLLTVPVSLMSPILYQCHPCQCHPHQYHPYQYYPYYIPMSPIPYANFTHTSVNYVRWNEKYMAILIPFLSPGRTFPRLRTTARSCPSLLATCKWVNNLNTCQYYFDFITLSLSLSLSLSRSFFVFRVFKVATFLTLRLSHFCIAKVSFRPSSPISTITG